jgi:lipid-A-disaccharide synthase
LPLLNRIKASWKTTKPDKVILVDYYGFNIHLAKAAKKMNIPVYYYISPQVWASRRGRINKIKQYVSKMLVILPFEEQLYKENGVDAVFVGHPLIDIVPAPESFPNNEKLIIGFFPGSRKSVIEKHLPLVKGTILLIRKKINADFIVFGIKELSEEYKGLGCEVVYENGYASRNKLSLAISVSGTVSLENALLGIPMIIFYRLSRLNYCIARMIVKIKNIAMANILLGEDLVPELIQENATPENLADTAVKLLGNDKLLAETRNKLLSLRKILGSAGTYERAAHIILKN